jgi:hypothetical protein
MFFTKKIAAISSLFIVLLSCQKATETVQVEPSNYLTVQEQEAFKYSIIRYFDKLPKKVTHNTKFDTLYDSIYQVKTTRTDLYYYYPSQDGFTYFAVTRIAPSMKLKKVATLGRLKTDENKQITHYEEIARTWKMEEIELKEKTEMLFRKMITGEDLSPYYTVNSKPELIIEFPDENNWFDLEKRRWVSSLDEYLEKSE